MQDQKIHQPTVVPARRPDLAPRQPNLLGIGCAKCGTTSLAALLAEHPEVSSPIKEFHFFDRGGILPEEFEQYTHRFEPTRWRMDFTPSYIMDRHARFLIRDWLGTDLHFLVILRNPVDRAYSHYCHATKNWLPGSKWVEKMGYPVETLTFEQAIEQEFARMVFDPFHTRHLSYFSKGLYHQQLRRWFELFDRSRFTVLIFEELIANPQTELMKLRQALDIELDFSKLQKKNSQTEGGLPPSTYRNLWQRYEAEILLLEEELELDLSCWKNPS